MSASISERAEEGEHAEELFPAGSLQGDSLALGKLVRAGEPVEVVAKLRAILVPIPSGGLVDPRSTRMAILTFEPGKVETAPTRENGRIVGWQVRQHLTPIFVEPVTSAVAAGVEASFEALLHDDPKAAAKALDAMQAKAARALT